MAVKRFKPTSPARRFYEVHAGLQQALEEGAREEAHDGQEVDGGPQPQWAHHGALSRGRS